MVRGEGLSFKVEDLITHIIMTCNDDPSVSADKSVTYGKGLRATIIFLKVQRGNIVTCTQKNIRFHDQ